MSFAHIVCLVALSAAGLKGLPPTAPPAPPPDHQTLEAAASPTLGLEDFLARVQAAAPSLEAARRRVEAARALEATAGELPDPMLMLGLNNAGDGWSLGDNPMSRLSVQVKQALPSRDARDAQRHLAQARTESRQARYGEVQAELRLKAYRAFAAWETRHRLLPILEEGSQWMALAAALEESRLAEGHGSTARFLKARAQLARLQDLERAARRQLDMQRVMMNTLLDRPADAPLPPPAEFISRFPEPERTVQASQAAHPKMIHLEARTDMLNAKDASAEAMKKPMWSVEGGFSHRGDIDPMVNVMVGVSLPFRSKKVAAAKQASIRAERAQLDAERSALERDLANQAARARLQLINTQETLAALEQDILPQARAALDNRLAAYGENPSVNAMSLIDDVRFLLELQKDILNAQQNGRLAEAELDYLLRPAQGVQP